MKAAAVAATPFVFVSVIVRVDEPPVAIDAGANAFEIEGGVAVTVRVAFAGAVFEGAIEVTAAAPIVLPYALGSELVTRTVTVQFPLAGIVPPESSTDPAPAAAVTVPPQVVAAPGAEAFTRPAG